MKPLILILFCLSSIAGAQATDAGFSKWWKGLHPEDNRIKFSKSDSLVWQIGWIYSTGKKHLNEDAFIATLLGLYSRYEKECGDTIEVRGWDRFEADTTRFKLDSSGNKLYYFAKAVPTYYRQRREWPPTFLGFIDWLRKQK